MSPNRRDFLKNVAATQAGLALGGASAVVKGIVSGPQQAPAVATAERKRGSAQPQDAERKRGSAQPQDAERKRDSAQPQDAERKRGSAQPQEAERKRDGAQPQDAERKRDGAQPQETSPEVIVVGAGAFGGWTAYYLATLGAKVTLVDAYGPGNSRATSGARRAASEPHTATKESGQSCG